jgi:lipoprotein-anchoring transpeptidase ErfK/SrfK
MSVRILYLAACASLLALAPTLPASAAEARDIAAASGDLRPGEYVWQPGRARAGEVEIVVSIPLQRAFVYRGGELIGVTTVSTGREGHETPLGTFNILQKRQEHYSNLYDNAPMPFMQRLTWDGVALHGGEVIDGPASHGCIRLPPAFARQLFAATELGGSVHVVDFAPSAREALAMARRGDAYAGMGGPDEVEDAAD